MRQTAAQGPYVAPRVVVSRHGPSSAYRSSCHRPGFTLVEVVVAAAILIILMVSLMAVFSAGVSGFKNAQLMTFAQNLAEFQAEDLKSLPSTILKQLCEGTATGVAPGVSVEYTNYPYPTADASDPNYDADALANDAKAWVYDSGPSQTDFSIVGVDAIVKDISTEYPTSYRAGGPMEPVLPSDPPLLLGTNILVETYLRADPLFPPDEWYYVIRLMHQAYPLFSKQVQVECYDAQDPSYHFVSDPSVLDMDEYVTDARAMFSYTVTVRYRQGASVRMLYETRGIISSPYS
jgi:type II secretory pathway pseudopilin PulG